MEGVLVTGGGQWLGATIARHLGREGRHVFVHYHHAAEAALAVAADIIAQGGQATPMQADLADSEAVLQLYQHCEAICPVSLLINSASHSGHDTAATVSPAGLEAHLHINLHAPVLLTHSLHTALTQRGARGVAINIVDNRIFGLNPDYFSYSLSKIALQSMLQMQAITLAPTIRVAGLAPGLTLINGAPPPQGGEKILQDFLHGVDFILATPAYHGQTIVIDDKWSSQHQPRAASLI